MQVATYLVMPLAAGRAGWQRLDGGWMVSYCTWSQVLVDAKLIHRLAESSGCVA